MTCKKFGKNLKKYLVSSNKVLIFALEFNHKCECKCKQKLETDQTKKIRDNENEKAKHQCKS